MFPNRVSHSSELCNLSLQITYNVSFFFLDAAVVRVMKVM